MTNAPDSADMPEEIWMHPAPWGQYCMTAKREAACARDTHYVRKDIADTLAKALVNLLRLYQENERETTNEEVQAEHAIEKYRGSR